MLARDAELLRWQHPRSDDELSLLRARDGGATVGLLGVVPTDVCVHGDRRAGAWLTTWVVVPEARERGVALTLLDRVLHDFDFVGTIGGNATTNRILGALRFTTVPSVPRWVRPIDAEGLAALGLPPPPERRTAVARDGAWDAAAWDEQWARLAPDLVGTWRDAAYVTRRYLEHPRFAYRVRTTGGALVVDRLERVRGADASVVRVVEALGAPEPLAGLLAAAVEDGRAEGAAFADFYCTSERSADALAAAGFVRDTELAPEPPSRFQPLEPAPRPLAAAYRLASRPDALAEPYFTRSDCDQDRPS